MTTTTLTLTEFLLARIAEDEAVARAAVVRRGSTIYTDARRGGKQAALAHIARHNPARVLAECEAKRRIVELHGGEHVCWQPDYPVDGDFAETNRWGDCATIRYVAAVYADHPDYDESWRP